MQSVPFCYISLVNIKYPDTIPPFRIIGQNESENLWPVAAAENKSAFEIGSRRVEGDELWRVAR